MLYVALGVPVLVMNIHYLVMNSQFKNYLFLFPQKSGVDLCFYINMQQKMVKNTSIEFLNFSIPPPVSTNGNFIYVWYMSEVFL